MESIKNPSGATMLERGERVKDRVKAILINYPQARGDDTLLIWRYLRANTGVRLKFNDFKQLLMCPAFETIRRRRQELQAACPELKPSQRVVRKRYKNELAHEHYYGKGLTLGDYL